MIPVFTFRRLDFIIPSVDGYVKTHSSWSTARGCVLKNLQGWADPELINKNKPISLVKSDVELPANVVILCRKYTTAK